MITKKSIKTGLIASVRLVVYPQKILSRSVALHRTSTDTFPLDSEHQGKGNMPRTNHSRNKQHHTPHTPRTLGFCTSQQKQRFTKRDATILSHKIRRRDKTNHRPYACQSCRSWHFGSSLNTRKVRK